MDGVGTPIIGRPRPLPSHDTPNPAHNTYTLKCEEPIWSNRIACEIYLELASPTHAGPVNRPQPAPRPGPVVPPVPSASYLWCLECCCVG